MFTQDDDLDQVKQKTLQMVTAKSMDRILSVLTGSNITPEWFLIGLLLQKHGSPANLRIDDIETAIVQKTEEQVVWAQSMYPLVMQCADIDALNAFVTQNLEV